jgi:hypothetical protein
MTPPRLLIHVCCAPCLIGALRPLRAESFELEGYFHNPNIHPLLEFRKRVKALRVFSEKDALPLEIDENYGLDLFIRQVYSPDPVERCRRCHSLRLRRTAERAAERGFETFTTTLLGSPHQDHEMVKAVGEKIAGETGVEFLYRDLRPAHDEGHEEARRRGIYLQPYCGCCFSEYERYRNTTREIYRGGGPGSDR